MQCQSPALCLEARWGFVWPTWLSGTLTALVAMSPWGSPSPWGQAPANPIRLAANANKSELHLDILLHAERIVILNYHLIHRGWLRARKPQLQSAMLLESTGEPSVPQPGNRPAERQLRRVRRREMDGSGGIRRRQTPRGCCSCMSRERFTGSFTPCRAPGWELEQGNRTAGEPEASLASLERCPLKLLCVIGH